MKSPVAFLFPNGDAGYFGIGDAQVVELQRLGWSGLHAYVLQFPHAPVYMGSAHEPLCREYLSGILRHIRRRPSRREKP